MPDAPVTRIWVEELTLPELLSLLACSVFRWGSRVMYDPRAATPAARAALKLFRLRLFEASN